MVQELYLQKALGGQSMKLSTFLFRAFLILIPLTVLGCHAGDSSDNEQEPAPIPVDCSCPALIAWTVSPTSGAVVPLAVTFDIFVSGTFSIDFGDGSTPAEITADCTTIEFGVPCATTMHAYNEGVFNAVLTAIPAGSSTIFRSVTVASGGTQASPFLNAVTPLTARAGDFVTLTGSGFIAISDTVLLDGNGIAGSGLVPTSDTSLTFTLENGLPVGAHSLQLLNLNGISNALSFTIEP